PAERTPRRASQPDTPQADRREREPRAEREPHRRREGNRPPRAHETGDRGGRDERRRVEAEPPRDEMTDDDDRPAFGDLGDEEKSEGQEPRRRRRRRRRSRGRGDRPIDQSATRQPPSREEEFDEDAAGDAPFIEDTDEIEVQ